MIILNFLCNLCGVYSLARGFFEECGVSYFEGGGVVLRRVWCGSLKSVVWYFESGGVLL